ncbi:MAG: GDP-mannose 4,6-dehydratase [Candidatus Hodarchaeota archaeon]
MDKIVVTGANGFIGSHLIDFCIKNNFEIYGIDRPNQSYRNLIHYTKGKSNFSKTEMLTIFGEIIQIPTDNENLNIIECDIKNASLLDKIINCVKPKFIFHFAAQPYVIPSWENPVDTIEINVIGTINLFEAIKKSEINPRTIVACTSAEYGTTTSLKRPLNEEDPLLAVHPYGISKIATELLARQYYLNFGIEIVNLRFFNQTGPRKVGDVCADFVSKVAKIELGLMEPVIQVGNLDSYRDFTDIKDSVNAIWLAATKGKPGETYNICTNKRIQIRRLLDIVLSFSKEQIEVVENFPDKLRKVDEDIIVGDNSKIKEELGWQPRIPIETTLKEMFNYWLDYYRTEILIKSKI